MPVSQKARKRKPVKRQRPGARMRDPIPVGPLRERYVNGLKAGHYTAGDVAGWAGMVDRRGRADTSQLQRRLGLKPNSPSMKKGKVYVCHTADWIPRPMAYRIAEALGWDPVDVDSWVEEYGFDLAEDAA